MFFFFFFSLSLVVVVLGDAIELTTTTTLVSTSLENRLLKAQHSNANVWINNRRRRRNKTLDVHIYAWLNGKSFDTSVRVASRWSINIDLDDFSMCRTSQSVSIIDRHMACLFFSSTLIDQMLSLASSLTRQKYIDNDQLDNLFLPTSWRSYYCCCYLFVFLWIFSFPPSCYLHFLFLVHFKSSTSTSISLSLPRFVDRFHQSNLT